MKSFRNLRSIGIAGVLWGATVFAQTAPPSPAGAEQQPVGNVQNPEQNRCRSRRTNRSLAGK